MKRNIKAVIEFDGSYFKGFQKQIKWGPTVQGVLEQAIKHTLNEKIKIYGCSRTDAGVHACNYTISFRTENPIPAENLRYVTNKKLPLSVHIKSMEEVDFDFHARHLAKKKYYIYKVLRGERPEVFEHNYKYYFPKELDIKIMEKALMEFVGKKDFRAFSSKHTDVTDFRRTVYEAYLTEEGNELWFHFVGRGFVYNMIRIIVGTVLDVGIGKRQIDTIVAALETGDRNLRSKKAPASGLYLKEVYY